MISGIKCKCVCGLFGFSPLIALSLGFAFPSCDSIIPDGRGHSLFDCGDESGECAYSMGSAPTVAGISPSRIESAIESGEGVVAVGSGSGFEGDVKSARVVSSSCFSKREMYRLMIFERCWHVSTAVSSHYLIESDPLRISCLRLNITFSPISQTIEFIIFTHKSILYFKCYQTRFQLDQEESIVNMTKK